VKLFSVEPIDLLYLKLAQNCALFVFSSALRALP